MVEKQILHAVWIAVVVLMAIGALMWGWVGITGRMLTANSTFRRVMYSIIGIAGVIGAILLVWALINAYQNGLFCSGCWI